MRGPKPDESTATEETTEETTEDTTTVTSDTVDASIDCYPDLDNNKVYYYAVTYFSGSLYISKITHNTELNNINQEKAELSGDTLMIGIKALSTTEAMYYSTDGSDNAAGTLHLVKFGSNSITKVA